MEILYRAIIIGLLGIHTFFYRGYEWKLKKLLDLQLYIF